MASRPLIKETLFILNICGTDPFNSSLLSNARFLASQSIIVVLVVELLLGCAHEWNGLQSMDSVSIIIAVFQLLCKFCGMKMCRATLLRLVTRMEGFWPDDRYGTAEETAAILASLKRISNYVLGFVSTAVLLYFIRPFLAGERALPYPTFHPRDLRQSPQYEMMYLLQIAAGTLGACSVLGFDGLFVALSAHVVCQIKLVKQGFAKVLVDGKGGEVLALRQISRLVDHHNLILRCINGLNRVYCVLFLNLFLANMFCICVGLLCVVADGMPPNLETLSKNGMLVGINVGQLFFYCIVGSLITTESESLTNVVYEMKWWAKTQPRLRKACVMVMQRANKAERLTAGKMIVLNLDSFSNIIRSALSFFTFVQAIYETEEEA